MSGVTDDVHELNKYLVAIGLDAAAPKTPQLTLDDERRLVSGEHDDVLRSLAPGLIRQDLYELALPDWYATKYSYGLGHKGKIRERLFKRALPETLRVQLDGEIRAMTDVQLLGLIGQLGIEAPGTKAIQANDPARLQP